MGVGYTRVYTEFVRLLHCYLGRCTKGGIDHTLHVLAHSNESGHMEWKEQPSSDCCSVRLLSNCFFWNLTQLFLSLFCRLTAFAARRGEGKMPSPSFTLDAQLRFHDKWLKIDLQVCESNWVPQLLFLSMTDIPICWPCRHMPHKYYMDVASQNTPSDTFTDESGDILTWKLTHLITQTHLNLFVCKLHWQSNKDDYCFVCFALVLLWKEE